MCQKVEKFSLTRGALTLRRLCVGVGRIAVVFIVAVRNWFAPFGTVDRKGRLHPTTGNRESFSIFFFLGNREI